MPDGKVAYVVSHFAWTGEGKIVSFVDLHVMRKFSPP